MRTKAKHRSANLRPRLGMLAAGALFVACAAGVRAQDLPIDRWLATAVETSDGDPLGGPERFPDRDLHVGPGYWTLLRDDGRSKIDLASGRSTPVTLGHTYVRASRDVGARLSIEPESCAEADVWLNGQRLAAPRSRVRLAGGWNTLLVRVTAEPGCARTVDARLSTPVEMRDRDESEVEPVVLRVQASRPPGVRPTFPSGGVAVDVPRISGLSWLAELDDLSATLSVDLTAWGRGAGATADTRETRPSGPPSVDLTGDWSLTIYGPTGIQRVSAELVMEADGTLTGRLRGARDRESRDRARAGIGFEGDVRDGWVSGTSFGWDLRLSGRGRSGDLEFRGTSEDGRLAGTIRFDGLSDFDSRFEGRPAGEEEVDSPPTEGEPPGRGARPGAAASPEPPGAEPGSEEATGPTDPGGQRARMIRQLLRSEAPAPGAPTDGSVELDVAGARVVGAASGLVPGQPHEISGWVPFRNLRDAALRDRGLKGEVRWSQGSRKIEGTLRPEPILEALHGPILLGGLREAADGARVGELRVPRALAGFTLHVGEGDWRVDGVDVTNGQLCSPCDRNRRLRIEFRAEASVLPTVTIADRGFVDTARDAGVAPAIEWLRALEGDNRRYRGLAGG